MFAQIKGVVDVLTSGFKTVREFKSEVDRERSIVDMLRVYFFLKDAVDEGESLIIGAGSNPAAKLASLSVDAGAQLVAKWDLALRQQAARLYTVQGLLFAQDALAVMNPELQAKLNRAIGNKMNRAITLHGIGSALVIRSMFPLKESPAEMADLVLTMAGEREELDQSRSHPK